MYASCFHQKVKTAHTHTKIPTAFICTSHVRFHNFMQMISKCLPDRVWTCSEVESHEVTTNGGPIALI